MTTNEKRITMKSLKEEINNLKEQLKFTKIYVEGMEEKLTNATKEIEKLKGTNQWQINAIGIKCNSC